MKNTETFTQTLKEKLVSKYLDKKEIKNLPKSTDINVLLNRVKTNQKNESRRKLYFSASACAGLFLFGFIIF
jgi:hypothetical protein